jgi:hypothetical protein
MGENSNDCPSLQLCSRQTTSRGHVDPKAVRTVTLSINTWPMLHVKTSPRVSMSHMQIPFQHHCCYANGVFCQCVTKLWSLRPTKPACGGYWVGLMLIQRHFTVVFRPGARCPTVRVVIYSSSTGLCAQSLASRWWLCLACWSLFNMYSGRDGWTCQSFPAYICTNTHTHSLDTHPHSSLHLCCFESPVQKLLVIVFSIYSLFYQTPSVLLKQKVEL